MSTRSASRRARLTTAIDPAGVARFRADLTAAAGRRIAPDEVLALAVSGGPDSIAMLALAVAAFPGQVVAATYDHRVRVGSAAEARAVGKACGALGVPHAVLKPALKVRVFRHAEARAGRYAALAGWAAERGARLLLTAHHADDQAETLLMRLNRGSGIAGLAGIRTKRAAVGNPFVSSPSTSLRMNFDAEGIEVEKRAAYDSATFLDCARNERGRERLLIVRPLLGWRRAELRALAGATGLPFIDDPSNTEPRFERARVRAFLAEQEFLDPAQLARSAAHLGEAEADLRAAADWLWDDRRRDAPAGQVWLDLGSLPRELQRRLVRRGLETVAGVPFDPAANVEALLDALRAGRPATQAEVLVRPHAGVWRFQPAPPRRA